MNTAIVCSICFNEKRKRTGFQGCRRICLTDKCALSKNCDKRLKQGCFECNDFKSNNPI